MMKSCGQDFVPEAIKKYGNESHWQMQNCTNPLVLAKVVYQSNRIPYRDDVDLFIPALGSDLAEEPDLIEMRAWFLKKGVLIQRVEHTKLPNRFGYYTIPIDRDAPSTAYHATLLESWPSICTQGLRPGNYAEGRASTGERPDCQGLFFVVTEPGSPEDAEADKESESEYGKSAHQWRRILMKKRAEGGLEEKEFAVLKLDRLNDLPGLRAASDVLSKHGIILAGVDPIPPNHITLEWPK